MRKYGFEIKLNNEKLCRAGMDVDYYVVSCNLITMMRKNDIQEEITIAASATNLVNRNHVRWMMGRPLKKGDKISIEIIDDDFDEPTEIVAVDADEIVLQQKIRHFHKLKEELKEHLKE